MIIKILLKLYFRSDEKGATPKIVIDFVPYEIIQLKGSGAKTKFETFTLGFRRSLSISFWIIISGSIELFNG